MYKIDKALNTINKIEKKRFSDLGFSERQHLQEWIEKNTGSSLGEELLIIQKEFAGFDDTKERLDLLAIDKAGNLVIIENKLDDSGKDVVWQALKYASYCSTLNKEQIVNIFQKYLSNNNAEDVISEFIGDDLDVINLNKSQRIILVANSFRKEVTSTVLWLLLQYQLQIQCIKVNPYEIDNEVVLNFEQIIPVPEIKGYMISMSIKDSEERKTDNAKEDRSEQHEEFWKLLEEKLKLSSSNIFNSTRGRDHKKTSKDGFWETSGKFHYAFYFNKKKTRVEFVILCDTPQESNAFFDEFIKYKQDLHNQFGNELSWFKDENKQSSKIRYYLNCDINDRQNWDIISNQLVDALERLEKAINSVLPEIKNRL